MFLEKNCQALILAQAEPPAWLADLPQHAQSELPDIQLLTTDAGDYTLHYQGLLLHSPQGAAEEARQLVQKECRPSLERVHVILGMGLGYVLEAAFERSPGRIVVYEPDLALLAFILSNVDLSEYLASGRLWLVASLPELISTLYPMITGSDPLDILVLKSHACFFAAEIPVLMSEIIRLMDERLSNYRTGKHFHSQWTRQLLQNLPHFAHTQSFQEWSTQYTGKPAIIISRGPSLDAAMEDLRALAPCATLIAVGGALHRLYQEGITPDIAVFYDANGMQEQLHGLPATYLENIIFLLSPFTQACCFEAPAKAKTLFFIKHYKAMANWLTPALEKPLLLDGGGTVSLIALQTAMIMRCDPIVLVGQDLAFPNQQVYAGGIALQTDEQGRMDLTKTETLFAMPQAMTQVEGQNGSLLPTLGSFAGFIRHFERMAETNAQQEKPRQLINTSLGGAKIKGYTLQPLNSLCGQLPAWKQSLPNPLPTNRGNSSTADALRQCLTQLRLQLVQAIALHQTLLTHSWQTNNDGVFDFLKAHPLIEHFLLFEMLDANHHFNPKPATPEEITKNGQILQQRTERSLTLLQDQILPWVISAETRLLQQQSNPSARVGMEAPTHSV